MLKGKVVFVQIRGKAARVGARSEDGLMWFWTTKGPAPHRGQIVEIPMGAKPEPSRCNGPKPEERNPARSPAPEAQNPPGSSAPTPEDVERMLRAVALKAAAQLYSGQGQAELTTVMVTAERFLSWLKGPSPEPKS